MRPPSVRIGALVGLLALALPALPALALAPIGGLDQPGADRSDHERLGQPRVTRSDERPSSGLDVSIQTLSPDYLTGSQPIQMSGTVANLDTTGWTNLKVYLVVSTSPMTTGDQLTAAADSDPATYIGDRITEIGSFDELGDLAAGDSVGYSLDVPYRRLGISGSPGVYSVAVQVKATDVDGIRPQEAVGRARTFMPLMSTKPDATVAISQLWPLDVRALRSSTGSYAGASDLIAQISSDGRLQHLIDLLGSDAAVPVAISFDPAILDALDSLATGTSGGPPSEPDGTPSPTEPAPTEPGPSPDPESDAGIAATFLRDLLELTDTHETWLHPYGRADLEAIAAREQLQQAVRQASRSTLAANDVAGNQLYWPISGFADPQLLSRVQDKAGRPLVVLGAEELSDWVPSDGPVQQINGPGTQVTALVADPSVTDGGPAPGITDTALQVRQRLLSETALMALQASYAGVGTVDMTFTAGPDWDPGADWASADFFSAFDAPWLVPGSLGAQLALAAPKYSGDIKVPDNVLSTPLASARLSQARDLFRRTSTLKSLVVAGPATGAYYAEAVATSVSQWWRQDPVALQDYTDESARSVATTLSRVTVEGPEFVTLSSSRGRFPLTITNDLDREVNVGVRITSDDGSLAIGAIDPVTVGPRQSTTVTVQTTVSDVGVIAVSARLITTDGRAFGSPARFNLRTSVVGVVIWVLLGVAAAVFLVAVARRLQRSRGRRSRGQAT